MSKRLCLTLALTALLLTPACYTFQHKVGAGGSSGAKSEEQQWFILWGLVPLNHIDSHQMAEPAKDYTVTTQFTPIDVLISIFTAFVTIYVQTVQVEK